MEVGFRRRDAQSSRKFFLTLLAHLFARADFTCIATLRIMGESSLINRQSGWSAPLGAKIRICRLPGCSMKESLEPIRSNNSLFMVKRLHSKRSLSIL